MFKNKCGLSSPLARKVTCAVCQICCIDFSIRFDGRDDCRHHVKKKQKKILSSTERSKPQDTRIFHKRLSLLWCSAENHALFLTLPSLVPENVILGQVCLHYFFTSHQLFLRTSLKHQNIKIVMPVRIMIICHSFHLLQPIMQHNTISNHNCLINCNLNNNNVHLSCAHQRPERSHDTY